MRGLINWVLEMWGLEIVPTSHLSRLNSTIEEVVMVNSELIKSSNKHWEVSMNRMTKISELEQVIANNKFLPTTRPNLDLAVKTVIDWGSQGKEGATLGFLRRLSKEINDEVLLSLCKYVNTEIKKRGLNN